MSLPDNSTDPTRWQLYGALTALLFLSACGAPETPPSSAGVTSSADGVEIRYRVAGSGPQTLLFVHGWSCDRTYWDQQIDALKGDYRVVTIDLAGHGESGSNRDVWTMAAFGADVAAVADAVDAQNIVLVGHSMGGPVVLEATRLLGDRVDLVVGVDTLKTPSNGMPPEAAEAAWAPVKADFVGATTGFVRNTMFVENSDPALITRIADDMAAAPPEIAVPAGTGLMTYDAIEGLSATSATPLVLINASYTPTDWEGHRQLRSNVRLLPIETTGHFPMLEDPQLFNDVLLEAIGGR